MPSFRRVAFSLGLVAACGGAVFFSMSAKGQPGATSPGSSNSATDSSAIPATSGGAPGATPSSTVSPPLRQTIGISPVQTGKKAFVLFGGTGNDDDSYDLQNENVYSLLRQRGVPIPNILHPLSTAKPSFIVERLIVLSLTGGNNNTAATATGGASNATGGSTSPSGSTAAAAPAGPTDAEKTVSAVRAVVDAEIARGSGRQGGAHLQKLRLLSRSISSLEAANRLGSFVTAAVGSGSGGGSGSTGGTTKSKLDPREIFYGQARLTSRRADRYAPTGL